MIGKVVLEYENAKSDCAWRLMQATNFNYTYESRVTTHQDLKAKKLEKWIKMAHDKVSYDTNLSKEKEKIKVLKTTVEKEIITAQQLKSEFEEPKVIILS